MKVDYSKCKIYKLVDMINNYFYIGSTCDLLSKRLCGHRAAAKPAPAATQVRSRATDGVDALTAITAVKAAATAACVSNLVMVLSC